jgi:RNA polymerase sigma-70 factor (ECF subfamily)
LIRGSNHALMNDFVSWARLYGPPAERSTELSFDAAWIDEPAAADELEDALLAADGVLAQRAAEPRAPADDEALAQLIAGIVRRDVRALEDLYQATSARVYGFVHRFMRRHTWTEEVVEDTFWQVWRQAPRFDGQRGRAMTWLFAMARSRAIDALRREQRFQFEPLAADDEHEDTRVDDRAHDLLEATRGAAQLQRALTALEPRARQLVALAFFRGLTHEEIAVHTGMPLGSVKSVIRRALLQLREHLMPAAPGTAGAGTP